MFDHPEYFNATLVKALATADPSGEPDVCLCGSAYMVDENTVVAASAFFDQTGKNLGQTRKAVFLATRPLTPEFWQHYEETGERLYPAGIRYHCTVRGATTEGPELDQLKERLRARVGNRVPDAIRCLWIFDVMETRELEF